MFIVPIWQWESCIDCFDKECMPLHAVWQKVGKPCPQKKFTGKKTKY